MMSLLVLTARATDVPGIGSNAGCGRFGVANVHGPVSAGAENQRPATRS
jgi:hypothetical protein